MRTGIRDHWQIALVATLLVACAPLNTAMEVQPLTGTDRSVERLRLAGMVESLAPADSFEGFGHSSGDRSFHPQLEFMETVQSYGPTSDPRDVFLMVSFYLAANQHEVGIAFLERLLARYANQMDDGVRAAHLSAYAILRASWAEQVPIPGRIPWVLDTFVLLEEADRLARGADPIVHWASGLVYAQVPGFFGKREAAYAHLLWLAERPELEPTPGFYREAYRHLGELYAADGDGLLAAHYERKSGYGPDKPSVPFMGWFTTTREKGLTFAPTPFIEEIVRDQVFVARGFGFSEIYFVVTKDGKELVVVDAGTQPHSLEAAYEAFSADRGALPPLTAALITHAHWDHIGGHTFLRELAPEARFYGRGNYASTLERIDREPTYRQFRGVDFQNAWLRGYAPDTIVDETTEFTLGGTRFELVPVAGGETEDAMLVHMPEEGVIFVGDVMMPYYGEPFVEEGFVDEALVAMDEILRRRPEHVLHGHLGLTWMYGRQEIAVVRDAYAWLIDATRTHILSGYSSKDVVRLNLIPPGLQDHPGAFIGYLTGRDHLVARIADHHVGIWQEDVTGAEPIGLDTLTSIEYGRMLERYLGLSPGQVEDALRRMLDGGDNELALQISVAAERRYRESGGIRALKEEAAERLRARAQFTDPFGFVAYTELAGKEHGPIPAGAPPSPSPSLASAEGP